MRFSLFFCLLFHEASSIKILCSFKMKKKKCPEMNAKSKRRKRIDQKVFVKQKIYSRTFNEPGVLVTCVGDLLNINLKLMLSFKEVSSAWDEFTQHDPSYVWEARKFTRPVMLTSLAFQEILEDLIADIKSFTDLLQLHSNIPQHSIIISISLISHPWKKITRNADMEWFLFSLFMSFVDLFLCYKHKHRARHFKYLFYNVIRELTVQRRSLRTSLRQQAKMINTTKFRKAFIRFWHHSWIKSTFSPRFPVAIIVLVALRGFIYFIILYLLPDDSNQMESFQFLFVLCSAQISIIIYANFQPLNKKFCCETLWKSAPIDILKRKKVWHGEINFISLLPHERAKMNWILSWMQLKDELKHVARL